MPTPLIDVKVSGHEKLIDTMDVLGKSADAFDGTKWAIQNPAPYTHWIEEGYYRSGRPGQTTPRHMMAQGARRILQILPDALSRNLLRGASAVRNAVAGVMSEGTRTTKAATPVVSGRLRGGFHTVNTRR